MDQSAIVEKILQQYESLRSEGRVVSAEELCRDCPEVVGEVQRGIDAINAIQRLIDLTPSTGVAVADNSAALEHTCPRQAPSQVGRYRLDAFLGQGGFGQVWRGYDPELRRPVAVKIARPDRFQAAPRAEAFLKEARKVAQLRHRGIVPVYDVGHDGDCYYIVSELIDGANLADHISQGRPSVERAVTLVSQIADALHHAHLNHIIHRDIKPANILIDRSGDAHITDFGVAKSEADDAGTTLEGQILGTPVYMSPEQAKGHAHTANACTDVYSLGVVFFELLTGERPFRGDVRTLIKHISDTDPPSPRTLASTIPRDVETITLKCLEKEPRSRYASAQDLADDLRRWQLGEPIRARHVGRSERAWRWCRRNPLISGLASTAALLVILVAVVSTLGYLSTSAALERVTDQRGIAEVALDAESRARKQAEVALDAESRALKQAEVAVDAESRALKQAEANLYIATFKLAYEKWLAGDTRGAEAVLDRCPKEYRNWEWSYVKRRCHAYVGTLGGLSGGVDTVAYSLDSKWIAAGSGRTIKIWDAATGKEQHTLNRVDQNVLNIASSPDGARIAALVTAWDQPNVIVVWDVASGKQVLEITSPGRAKNLAFSPSGEHIAVCSGAPARAVLPDGIWLHNATDTEALSRSMYHTSTKSAATSLLSIPTGGADFVAYGCDGRYVASGGYGGLVRFWNVATGKEEAVIRGGQYRAISALAWSPDSTMIAVAAGSSVLCRGVARADDVRELGGHTERITSVAYSPDGKWLATGSLDKTIRVWSALDASEDACFRSGSPVNSIAFSPDGTRIISGGEDGCVRVWDMLLSTDALRVPHHVFASPHSAAVSCDGKLLATAGIGDDALVKLWDSHTGKELAALFRRVPAVMSRHVPHVRSVAFTGDGKHLLTYGNDGTARLFNIPDRREVLVLDTESEPLARASCSPSGKWVGVEHPDQRVTLWQVADRRQIAEVNGELLAFAPNDERVLYVTSVDTVRIRALQEPGPEVVLQPESAIVEQPQFSGDGQWVGVATAEQTVEIWDSATGNRVSRLRGHTGGVATLTFSPNCEQVATASSDATVRLWDVATGKEIHKLVGHSGPVYSVAFNYDGKRIASGGADKVIRLWDTADGQELCAIRTPNTEYLMFSSDGTLLISRGAGRSFVTVLSAAEIPSSDELPASRTPNTN